MEIKTKVPLKCSNCKGLKYIGDPYHAFGKWYVDITCLICADSKDVEVDKLKKLLRILEANFINNKRGKNVNRKSNR